MPYWFHIHTFINARWATKAFAVYKSVGVYLLNSYNLQKPQNSCIYLADSDGSGCFPQLIFFAVGLLVSWTHQEKQAYLWCDYLHHPGISKHNNHFKRQLLLCWYSAPFALCCLPTEFLQFTMVGCLLCTPTPPGLEQGECDSILQ